MQHNHEKFAHIFIPHYPSINVENLISQREKKFLTSAICIIHGDMESLK